MPERTHRFVIAATGLLVLHEIEELATGFVRVDPWTITAAQWLNLEPTLVFSVVQLAGIAFLGWLLTKRPTSRWLYWALGLIMIAELDHVLRAIARHSYYPGLATAIVILLFAIPYWWLILVPVKKRS